MWRRGESIFLTIFLIGLSLSLLPSLSQGQLEPQYVPMLPPDTVTCFPTDLLQWRSIPGKVIIASRMPPLKRKIIKKVPKPKQPAPPVAPPEPVTIEEPQPTPPLSSVDVAAAVAAATAISSSIKQQIEIDQGKENAAALPPVVADDTPVEEEDPDYDEVVEWEELPIQGPPQFQNQAAFQIKGLSWFGLDRINTIMGTNHMTIDEVMNFLVEHNFNALRIPFSLKFALSPMDEDDVNALGELQYPDRHAISPEYYALTSWEILDLLFEKANEKGILVLLDMHTLDPDKGIQRVWYDPEEYSEASVLWGWERILLRYSHHWNLFGVDIINENHDHASWGSGNVETDTNLYYERFIKFVNEHVPAFKGLFFAEGVMLHAYGREPSRWAYWWGGNLFGAEKYPVDGGSQELNDRIVYSPHIYGPDVALQNYFKDPDFPNNLEDVWDEQFGWLIKTLRKAVVVGEWGGSCNGIDGVVQEKLAQYMADHCLSSNFWWALNPGSADTSGIMNADWSRYDQRKMHILRVAQPDPSAFTYHPETKEVCMRHGAPANPRCGWDPTGVGPRQRTMSFTQEFSNLRGRIGTFFQQEEPSK